MPARVAIFLDHENLYIGWQQKTGARRILPEVIEAIAAPYGDIVIRRAYDNWSRDRLNARTTFQSYSYDCVDIETHRIDGHRTPEGHRSDGRRQPRRAGWRRKNMADVALATDAMLAAGRDYADIFIIGSGDGTFAYLAHKLHTPFQKQPVFIALHDNASGLLQESGFDLHYYEDWLDQAAPPPVAPPDPTDTYAADITRLLSRIETLRNRGLASPKSLIDLLDSADPIPNLNALLERARIRGDLIIEEFDRDQHLFLPAEVLEDRRPLLTPQQRTALLLVATLHHESPRPLKDWRALLRPLRDDFPSDPTNRDLDALLDQLKVRGLLIESRTGRRRAHFDLQPAALLNWLAEV